MMAEQKEQDQHNQGGVDYMEIKEVTNSTQILLIQLMCDMLVFLENLVQKSIY